MVNAIYAFSGDPITYGHINIIERASKMFDRLTVGIGVNPEKRYTFTLDERKNMAVRSLSKFSNVDVTSFEGLLVDYAYENNIPVVVRGVRNSADTEYEKILHEAGSTQKLGIDTIVLFADPKLAEVSSSVVKELQKYQGFVHELVPLYVKECLERKISGQYILGVTGEMGSGKSYISNKFVELGEKKGLEVHNIELDHIGHQILETRTEPVYVELRKDIIKMFGTDIANGEDKINRKALGEKVFGDSGALNTLNQLMYTPLMERLRKEMYGKKGLLLFNAALLVESTLSSLCNNNVLLIDANKNTQYHRLRLRNLNDDQIKRRLSSQYTIAQKENILNDVIQATNYGHIWKIDNSENTTDSVESVFDDIMLNSRLQ